MIFGMKTPLQWAPPYRSPEDRSSASPDKSSAERSSKSPRRINAPAAKNDVPLPGAAASGRAKL